MAIRINLLAESQAAEELRRKDPVKRALLVAGFLVFCALLWSSTLQVKVMAARGDLNRLESQWRGMEQKYQQAVDARRQALEAEEKMSALENYTTNRFLWGSTLNALQQTLNGTDGIQVVKLKTEQAYIQTEETKPRTNGLHVVPGRPGTSTERIKLNIEGIDAGPQPGEGISKYKEAISHVPFFQERLQKTNGLLLTSLSAPQKGTLASTPYVLFTLQCFFPEKVR